jgi:hypothetical protein
VTKTKHMQDAGDDLYEQRRDEFKIPNEPKPRTVHHVKSRVLWYQDILSGKKPFDVRLNDRGYKVGDILMLHEWDDRVDMEAGHYTGRDIQRLVTYIAGFGCEPGYVVLGFTR